MPFILPTADAVGQSQRIEIANLAPLRPVLIGSQARLHRYAQSAEKAAISLGTYEFGVDATYDWPDKEAGSDVDLDYVSVWMDDLLLNYFNDYVSSGSTVAGVSDYNNHVRAAGHVFRTANDVDRSSVLYDRDVTVGDVAYVRGTVDDVSYELWTTVTGFDYDVTAATTGAASADANNRATQSVSATVTQVTGTPVNDVVAVASAAGYDSLDDGYVSRTYTVTVTQSSTGGDATTALLSVVSADGLDDVDDVVPAAFSSPTDIGTKGGTLTFSIDSAHSSSVSGYSETDLVVGQQWTVTFNQAFTAPTATSAGTYTGPSDTTYRIEVTRGGLYAASTKPQITVSSSTGIDASGPTDVTAAATAIAAGAYGCTVAFNQTGLRKGDIYYFTVTAAADGPCRTLILNNDLSTAVDDDGNTGDLSEAADLDLRLFIRKSGVELTEQRVYPALSFNWTADADGITLKANYYGYDSTFVSGGVQVPIPATSATVYAQYREWVYGLAGSIVDVDSLVDVADALGTVDPDNPIAYACYKALQNTAGTLLTEFLQSTAEADKVRCVVLGTEPTDTDGWTEALSLVSGIDQAYNLVPLSQDADVHALVAAHVASQSDAAQSFFRGCLLSPSVASAVVLVDETTTSDEGVALATLSQNPAVVSTSYTRLRVPAGNARFQTNGVAEGDTVRYIYTLDVYGQPTYSEFTVAEVVSEDTLLLESGLSQSVSVAQKIEVWRTLSKAQLVSTVTALAATYESDRVCLVWPDTIGVGGVEVPGYFLCAALAGLAGSVPTQQGLRNVAIQGFDTAARSTPYFTTSQLDTMIAGGTFVVTRAPTGEIYTKWPATTDPSTVNTREEMIRRNKDAVAFALQEEWSDLVGQANLNDAILQIMRTRLTGLKDRLRTRSRIDRLGTPVFSLEFTSLGRHATLPDHVVATVTMTGPTPNNKIELTITVT